MYAPIPISLFCTLLICIHLTLFFSATRNTSLSTTSCCSSTNTTKNPSPKPQEEEEEKEEEEDEALLRLADLSSPKPKNTPVSQADEEEDEALFRFAGLTSAKPTTPKKIAFMFLTTTPLPLAPLWEHFFQTAKPANDTEPLYNIYIHADPSHPYDPPFYGIFSGRVIPSKPTRRSDPSLISAARRLLARALLHDPSNAVFALLSPSCAPLHSFRFVYETLLANRSTRSFIEILSGEPTLLGRYDARGPGAMLPEVGFESFRVGSQFFALARPHAWRVVRDTRLWGKFKLPCEAANTCYPEEHYFSTLLSTCEKSGTCVPATLTHVDWSGSAKYIGHPRTYEGWEVGPGLIRGLRRKRPRYGGTGKGNGSRTEEHPFLFARKFSAACLEPLMRIAADVIFRD